jgi:hypothetical protein
MARTRELLVSYCLIYKLIFIYVYVYALKEKILAI